MPTFMLRAEQLGGFQLSAAADGKTITITGGWCFIPGGKRINVLSDWTQTINATSAWRHFYAYQDMTTYAGMIEVSTVAPSARYQGSARTSSSDTARRYLGSIYFGSNGTCTPFTHITAGPQAQILFSSSQGALAPSQQLVFQSLLQSVQTVSVAALVPPTVRLLKVLLQNTAGVPAYLSNPDIGTVSATSHLKMVPASTGCYECELLLDAQQRFTYIMGAGLSLTGGLTVRALGYTLER